MLLKDLLAALSNNSTLSITLIDDNDNILITFNAAGYNTISSDLGERKVKRVKIVSTTSVTIAVEDAENNTTPTTDDTNTDPDNTNPSNPTTDPDPSNP